jgi:hypothetical protein
MADPDGAPFGCFVLLFCIFKPDVGFAFPLLKPTYNRPIKIQLRQHILWNRMARRRIGLRAFPRQQRLKYVKTDSESAFHIPTTSIDDLIFRSAEGDDSFGGRALAEYMKAIADARPAMFVRLLVAVLLQEVYEEYRASGRPIPPALRRR